MGLSQGDLDHRKFSKYQTWLLPGLIVVIALALALMGDSASDKLRYDRDAIEAGEVWRLLSGHLLHLGWSHFALNAAGLLLIFYLVGTQFTTIGWLLISIVTVVVIDLGFWIFEPQLIWYVGLSGLLHGYLAAGAISGLRCGQVDYWLLAGFLILKLAYEQLIGPLPGSEGTTGGSVVVAAHLYGAIGGALSGAVLSFRKARPASI